MNFLVEKRREIFNERQVGATVVTKSNGKGMSQSIEGNDGSVDRTFFIETGNTGSDMHHAFK